MLSMIEFRKVDAFANNFDQIINRSRLQFKWVFDAKKKILIRYNGTGSQCKLHIIYFGPQHQNATERERERESSNNTTKTASK